MDLTKTFGVDEQRVKEGVEIRIGDATLRIGGLDSPRARALRVQLMRQYRPTLSAGGELAARAMDEIAAKVLAGAVLLGWDGITDGGQPLEFTPKAAETVLQKYPGLRDVIEREAANPANFRPSLADDEDALGN